jgi:hypothetical protein
MFDGAAASLPYSGFPLYKSYVPKSKASKTKACIPAQEFRVWLQGVHNISMQFGQQWFSSKLN